MNRILVFAPNWLGDAVMAVPSVDAIRRQFPSATLAVAARTHLAALYELVPGVDEVLRLEPAGRFGGWLAGRRDARRLRDARFDLAILLPNSFRSAWIARRAGIAERWGYATDGRAKMLTRAVPPVHGVHQVEYYQRLLEGLGVFVSSGVRGPRSEVRGPESGVDSGLRLASPKLPCGEGGTPDFGLRDLPSVHLDIPANDRDWARRSLAANGWRPGEPLVGMAPGAAYGGAKQWPPERYAQLVVELAQAPEPVRTVLVGSAGDRAACDAIAHFARSRVEASRTPDFGPRTSDSGPRTSDFMIDLCGQTDLRQLAAVIAECRTFVSNDSGAMHLAAAVGVPVVAIFGSTNEKETAPLPLAPGTEDRELAPGTRHQGPRTGDHVIVATDLACRPCMLRECPIDGHPCMTGIDVARVKSEVVKRLRGVIVDQR